MLTSSVLGVLVAAFGKLIFRAPFCVRGMSLASLARGRGHDLCESCLLKTSGATKNLQSLLTSRSHAVRKSMDLYSKHYRDKATIHKRNGLSEDTSGLSS